MKILVTGAGGQLGRALVESLGARGLTRSELDIADADAVRSLLSTLRPDLVINAAAYTQVDEAEADPAGALRANFEGPRNLAETTDELRIPLVHVSTDYVFDGNARKPYVESDPTNPQSVYGRTKLEGERAVRGANPRHYIVRTAWLYAAWGQNFPTTMRGLADRPEVRVVDDQTGSPSYAPHVARAIAALIRTEAYGVHHFAGRGHTSWYGFTKRLYCELGIQTPVIPVTTAEFPRPAPRPAFSALGTEREPRIELPPWEEGLREFASAVQEDSK